jgi:hypothetical protein
MFVLRTSEILAHSHVLKYEMIQACNYLSAPGQWPGCDSTAIRRNPKHCTLTASSSLFPLVSTRLESIVYFLCCDQRGVRVALVHLVYVLNTVNPLKANRRNSVRQQSSHTIHRILIRVLTITLIIMELLFLDKNVIITMPLFSIGAEKVFHEKFYFD